MDYPGTEYGTLECSRHGWVMPVVRGDDGHKCCPVCYELLEK